MINHKANEQFEKGNSLYKTGRYEEAIQCYDQALQLEPGNASIWNNRGLGLSKLKRHEEAISCYDKALEINPKYLFAWCNRGISLNSLSRYKEALPCFDQALGLDMQSAIAWNNKGFSFAFLGLTQESLICFEKALELDPRYVDAWNNKGISLVVLGAFEGHPNELKRLEEALSCYDQALKLDPNSADAWGYKGTALETLKRYEEAIHCFDKNLELDPSHIMSWFYKGMAQVQLGLSQEAAKSYRQYLALGGPDDDSMKAGLARTIQELEENSDQTLNGQENGNNRIDSKQGQNKPEVSDDESYQPGDIIGQKYEVQKVLGEGGFGVVYLVRDPQFGGTFALKTFLEKYITDTQTRDLFRREAGIWVELGHHPYLVQAFFVDEISGRLFIAMEYIAPNEQGINTLDGYLKRQPPNLAQSLRWAIQICNGMEYAYSKGIRAHRDIKPSNIMIGQDGIAKVSDFGLASVLSASLASSKIHSNTQEGGFFISGQTQEGIGFGTAEYMPPEQFTNAAACEERSDIYSFGIVLYQMATGGALPFQPEFSQNPSRTESMRSWYRLHSESPVPRLNSPLFPIILHCLEKIPEKRFSGFQEIREKLQLILRNETGEEIRSPQSSDTSAIEWNAKGSSLNALGRYDDAINCLNKALEIDPHLAPAWNNKGASLAGLGRREEAINCYDQALILDPRYEKAWNNKGNTLNSMGRFDEAIHCFDKALELDSKYAKAWNNKGNSLDNLGQYKEAIHCYKQALELDPRYAKAWNNQGVSLYKLGRYEDAIRCFDKALEIDPYFADALAMKGVILDLLNR